jgi:hypothetical protein
MMKREAITAPSLNFNTKMFLQSLAITSEALLFEDFFIMQAVSGLVDLLKRKVHFRSSVQIGIKSEGKLNKVNLSPKSFKPKS